MICLRLYGDLNSPNKVNSRFREMHSLKIFLRMFSFCKYPAFAFILVIFRNSSVQMMVCSDSSLVKLRTIRIEEICATRPFNAAACEWAGMFDNRANDINVNLRVNSQVNSSKSVFSNLCLYAP